LGRERAAFLHLCVPAEGTHEWVNPRP
jgi:hypothetical protein